MRRDRDDRASARDLGECGQGHACEGGLRLRHRPGRLCLPCGRGPDLTTGSERRISCWDREGLVSEMDSRLGRDPGYMTLRRCTVEHPFGTIKAWMGGTHVLTRRLKNARIKMALNVLAYNIKRMIALLGVRILMKAMHGQSQSPLAPPDITVASRTLPKAP
jgi:Transposase DDE domain